MRKTIVTASGAALLSMFLLPASAATPEEKHPQEEGPPQVVSPWQSWDFNGSRERVRSEMLSLIKEQGLTITAEDEKKGTFVTDLVEFDDKKFGVDVGVPPPKAGPKYPYFQLNAMTSGKFGLEGRFSGATDGRTHLDLRALLETRGMDEKIRGMRWIPRVSNGEVERYFFTRLSLKLLNTPSDSSSPR
jgi:hypothetical protein